MTGITADQAAELCRQGAAHHAQGRYRAAHDAFAQAILHDPDRAEAYRGAAMAALAAADKAGRAGQRPLARDLRRLAAQHFLALGLLLKDQLGLKEAHEAYAAGLAADGENAQLWARLAEVAREGGYASEAEKAARRALSLDGRLGEAHRQLAAALTDLGRFEQAAEIVRKALALSGPDAALRWSLETGSLLSLHYRAELTAEQVFAAHRDWGVSVIARARTAAPALAATADDPDRRLRIGYVSADFRQHAVAYFFEPLLSHHDPLEVETFCYAQVARPDATTERLQASAHHWCSIVALDDAALRRKIAADRIDILVDLSGHTAGSRLSAFVVKPAPVTVTWLGYPGSTGLPTIDYRITDAVADPPGLAEPLHTEALLRLPRCFLCYRPPEAAPPVAPLPAAGAGRITFGSFNNLAKVTPVVVACWSRLLAAVPEARLILKSYLLRDQALRQRYAELFRSHGIEAERVELRGPVESTAAHLGSYAEIDIALDPFPYNGTTTTCEALWMGVPVVTLAGDRHAARVGASLLSEIGLGALIASDEASYGAIAAGLARDLAGLAALRAGLRARVQGSGLRDESGFARAVEATLREAWRRRCAS